MRRWGKQTEDRSGIGWDELGEIELPHFIRAQRPATSYAAETLQFAHRTPDSPCQSSSRCARRLSM